MREGERGGKLVFSPRITLCGGSKGTAFYGPFLVDGKLLETSNLIAFPSLSVIEFIEAAAFIEYFSRRDEEGGMPQKFPPPSFLASQPSGVRDREGVTSESPASEGADGRWGIE